jgi:ketosteroid isomerase-like protein
VQLLPHRGRILLSLVWVAASLRPTLVDGLAEITVTVRDQDGNLVAGVPGTVYGYLWSWYSAGELTAGRYNVELSGPDPISFGTCLVHFTPFTLPVTVGPALVRAQLTGNVAELDRLLDDALHFVGLGGSLLSKADDLAAHRSGVIRISKMACLERHIVPLGTVAVVSVLMDTEATVGGVPNAGQLRYTRVWQEKPDGWKLVAGHMSAM